MARKNRTPEENARREKIRELLQMANIGSMDDIQNLFKETIAEFMENGLEAELDDELGYSKYDYKNKDTDNSRNGHSSKTLRTSFGEVNVSVPRDRKGEFEPQVLKKNQTSISQDIEEKILSMYAKGIPRRTETDCRPYPTGKGRRESAYRAADHSLLADVPGRDLQDYGKEVQQKRRV